MTERPLNGSDIDVRRYYDDETPRDLLIHAKAADRCVRAHPHQAGLWAQRAQAFRDLAEWKR